MKDNLKIWKAEFEQELQNILSYWMKYGVDKLNGGFIGQVDAENKANPKAPKSAILNSRILWTFSRAYRHTQNSQYLELANRTYSFIKNHFLDNVYGGVYWSLNPDGSVENDKKQFYALSFTLYAFTEYYMICNSDEVLLKSIELFEIIERYSLDKEKNGYVEALSRKWEELPDLRLSEKDANERKTMNSHLHILEAYTNLYKVWKTEIVRKSIENLIELFLNKFIDRNGNLILFYDDDWKVKSSIISYGHDIECSWLLLEAAEIVNNQDLLTKVSIATLKMAKTTLNGLDIDGGLYNEKNKTTKHLDTDKHWWPQSEAVVGFYNAYQQSGNHDFLNASQRNWEFIKQYIIDTEKGEWHWRVNRSGKAYNEEKIGFWKCPYHNSRMCLEMIERIDKNLEQNKYTHSNIQKFINHEI